MFFLITCWCAFFPPQFHIWCVDLTAISLAFFFFDVAAQKINAGLNPCLLMYYVLCFSPLPALSFYLSKTRTHDENMKNKDRFLLLHLRRIDVWAKANIWYQIKLFLCFILWTWYQWKTFSYYINPWQKLYKDWSVLLAWEEGPFLYRFLLLYLLKWYQWKPFSYDIHIRRNRTLVWYQIHGNSSATTEAKIEVLLDLIRLQFSLDLTRFKPSLSLLSWTGKVKQLNLDRIW